MTSSAVKGTRWRIVGWAESSWLVKWSHWEKYQQIQKAENIKTDEFSVKEYLGYHTHNSDYFEQEAWEKLGTKVEQIKSLYDF